MATVLITYDVRYTSASIHKTVKDAMIAKGYRDEVKASDGRCYRLPNTSLIKGSISASDAAADLEAVCKATRAVLEKYFSVEYGLSSVFSDDVRNC